jgi:hypothetical protein
MNKTSLPNGLTNILTKSSYARASDAEKSYQHQLRVPFGIRNDRLYGPAETERGAVCGCSCPGCWGALVSNQGKKKRAYFSHLGTGDCPGGYESAVHLMAKQVIKDSLYLVVPEFTKVFRRTISTFDVEEEALVLPMQRLDFLQVRLEEATNGLRPDAVGVLEDGTEIFIEVFVTHAVSDEKRARFSKQSMIEIDLSRLDQSAVEDSENFRIYVLERAAKAWIACQLYKEEFRQARANLTVKVRSAVQYRRAQIEKKQADEKIRLDGLAVREMHRTQYEPLLNEVQSMVNGGGTARVNAMEREARWQCTNGLTEPGAEPWPFYLNHPQKNDWIFNVHCSVWQSYIFFEHIYKRSSGRTIDTNLLKREVVARFGLLESVERLIKLKESQKRQGLSRGQWYGRKGAWFFTDEENKMIPSPYPLILEYLEYLESVGLLDYLDYYRKIFAVPERVITALAGSFCPTNHASDEADHRAKRMWNISNWASAKERRESRICLLTAKVNVLVKEGHLKVHRCNDCSNFQEISVPEVCVECGCNKLWEREFEAGYLSTLHHRLRCMPIFPRVDW